MLEGTFLLECKRCWASKVDPVSAAADEEYEMSILSKASLFLGGEKN